MDAKGIDNGCNRGWAMDALFPEQIRLDHGPRHGWVMDAVISERIKIRECQATLKKSTTKASRTANTLTTQRPKREFGTRNKPNKAQGKST